MIREDWQAVGVSTVVTAVSGAESTTLWQTGNDDVHTWAGGAPDGPDILSYPAWIISHGNMGRWAPLFGSWMNLEGTAQQGVDKDKYVAGELRLSVLCAVWG